ncbi:hypothetical protein GZ77_03760 [Endozoicomonas montiporae]|uniref:Uncharacterized protein n=2 Tax=Endozoicomonas montiporae TaxID=1027273 RepID=A0A081NB75_9GAMM|nr:hypothetical protein [Endozoicomonas montiporae]AMO56583.1 hypothetical protein EZMO1_2501 [Endozoicomonas montiporae CL-33]KEQ15698.1 hypothetical protein GZ77_03760 [Endozoicomonas montiporae]
MNQYQYFRVTTPQGELVDCVYTCNEKSAAKIAFELFAKDFPQLKSWADLRVEAQGDDHVSF